MEKPGNYMKFPWKDLMKKNPGFLMTSKKSQGDDYETSSICNMISSFDKNLRKHGYEHSI